MKKYCPICGREIIEGLSVDLHHLIPKTHGNREKIAYKKDNCIQLHKICHRKIHSVFSTSELLKEYHTVEKIKSNSEIKKFIKWIQKKGPEFIDTHRQTRELKKKRKR